VNQPALAIAFLALLATIGFAWAAHRAAEEFFRRLVCRHPDMAKEFTKPGIFTKYGPIRPSYMDYLKSRKYMALDEPELRREAGKIRHLLYAHAACFLVLVLSALWWGHGNSA
jgi:hypothetical protein